jgi:hypothetical protein
VSDARDVLVFFEEFQAGQRRSPPASASASSTSGDRSFPQPRLTDEASGAPRRGDGVGQRTLATMAEKSASRERWESGFTPEVPASWFLPIPIHRNGMVGLE